MADLFARGVDIALTAVLGALNALWDLLAATVFTNPDVTTLPQVVAFADRSLQLVDAAYVLAFLWAGVLVMGRGTLPSAVEPDELLPRLVLGLLGANFALPICSWMITGANAVTAALTGQSITSPQSLQLLRATVLAAVGPAGRSGPTALLMLLLTLLITVLVGTLVVQYIARVGLLVVLAGVAPLALALHGTPQTEAVAKLWWRALGGALVTVLLQAAALHAALTVFLSPDANLPVLGVPGESNATINLLVVLCLFWAVVKMPGLLRRFVMQPQRGGAATFVRVVLVQQLTRALRAGLGAGRPQPAPARSGAGPAMRRPPLPTRGR